jgi:hypothetical protein
VQVWWHDDEDWGVLVSFAPFVFVCVARFLRVHLQWQGFCVCTSIYIYIYIYTVWLVIAYITVGLVIAL